MNYSEALRNFAERNMIMLVISSIALIFAIVTIFFFQTVEDVKLDSLANNPKPVIVEFLMNTLNIIFLWVISFLWFYFLIVNRNENNYYDNDFSFFNIGASMLLAIVLFTISIPSTIFLWQEMKLILIIVIIVFLFGIGGSTGTAYNNRRNNRSY